jgi:tripartite-type tricarboxylate transporter receptor subunit TctC
MKMKKVVMMLLVGFLLVSLCVKPGGLWAAPANYYEGQVLTIIVGHAPGGGYDRMSRLLARYLPKHIPGKPAVIVKQMTGGGTVIAANYLYNQAKPDGFTISALDRGIGTRQLMGLEGVKYDFTKYAWIGNVASEPTGLFLTTKLPYKTFGDLLKEKSKKLFLGASGFGNYTATLPLILRDYLGINIEIVTYPEATATIMLAIERGEVHGHYSAFSTYLPLIQRGTVKPLLRGKAEPGGEFDKLPIIDNVVTDKTASGIIKIFSAVEVVARPYVAPPGTPENVMKILREAFANVLKDKEFLLEIEKQKMEAGFMSAEESLKVVRGYMASPAEIIKAFKKYDTEEK